MDSTFGFNQISSRRQVQDHSIFIPKIEQNNSYLHEALSNKRYECNDVSTRPQNGLLRLFLGFYGNLWPWKTGFLFIFLPCSLASPQQTKSWEWHFMRAKTLMSASALRSVVNIKKHSLMPTACDVNWRSNQKLTHKNFLTLTVLPALFRCNLRRQEANVNIYVQTLI